MPKGVVWRQEDAFYACFGGGDFTRQNPLTDPAGITDRIMETPIVFFPLAPLMHGAAQWTTWAWFLAGGRNLLTRSAPRTDYAQVWRMITDHKANVVTIIGDAVARPLIDEYLAHRDRYDASSIFSFGSGAVPLSPAGREELHRVFPNVMVNDGYGASETWAQAANLGDGRFASTDDETRVIDPETLEEVAPGSGAQGRIARRGHIPLGYYNDPEASAASFEGTWCAIEGDPEAKQALTPLFKTIGGRLFEVKPESKAIYHGASVFASNNLVALMEISMRCYEQAGISRETAMELIQPLVNSTLQNLYHLGPEKALTGPIARGEVNVVRRQYEALGKWDPQVAELYARLGLVALELSHKQGNASEANLKEIKRILEKR
jgi:acyl-CoA synthetase (AMP-forming)/AMP-acid ligase II